MEVWPFTDPLPPPHLCPIPRAPYFYALNLQRVSQSKNRTGGGVRKRPNLHLVIYGRLLGDESDGDGDEDELNGITLFKICIFNVFNGKKLK